MKTRTANSNELLNYVLSEPLPEAKKANVQIIADDGNLTIDQLTNGEPVLASGTLQYFEKQAPPSRTLEVKDGHANLTVRGSRAQRPWFHLPWSACNGATEWQIYLNPTVSSDIAAHSEGGNVKLKLAGLSVARVSADTGGGNLDVVLPDNAENLSVTAKTGAGDVTVEIGSGITGSNIVDASSGVGNVLVRLPSGSAARIHATTGLGEVIIDPWFSKTEDNTYQSPDFARAANQFEIMVNSGVGNVSVNVR